MWIEQDQHSTRATEQDPAPQPTVISTDGTLAPPRNPWQDTIWAVVSRLDTRMGET